ncbi:MAG: hypothetical protein LH479_05145 [Polaromonas sp.]|nr:hypothetical protein [Polaromonas sp.]
MDVTAQQPEVLRCGRDPDLTGDPLGSAAMAVVQGVGKLPADRHQRDTFHWRDLIKRQAGPKRIRKSPKHAFHEISPVKVSKMIFSKQKRFCHF